jgi:hypothetical protein
MRTISHVHANLSLTLTRLVGRDKELFTIHTKFLPATAIRVTIILNTRRKQKCNPQRPKKPTAGSAAKLSQSTTMQEVLFPSVGGFGDTVHVIAWWQWPHRLLPPLPLTHKLANSWPSMVGYSYGYCYGYGYGYLYCQPHTPTRTAGPSKVAFERLRGIG